MVEVKFTSKGVPLVPDPDVYSIEILKDLDRIPEARLILRDGCVAEREFAQSTMTFAPGTDIEIALSDGVIPAPVQVFKGFVLRQRVSAGPDGTELLVELRDHTFMLTRGRKGNVYRDELDHKVIEKILGAAAPGRVTAGMVAPTTIMHAELIQFNSTDWDFLVSRADANGLVVLVDDGMVSLHAITEKVPVKPDAIFEFGSDAIFEFELELDAGEQWGEVSSMGPKIGEQGDVDSATADGPVQIAAGNLDPLAHTALVKNTGGEEARLTHGAPLSPAELKAIAAARLARSRFALIRGHIVVEGQADLKPFDRINVSGVGDRYNGDLLVSGITHHVDPEGWRTELRIGLSAEPFARTPNIAGAPAGGLIPPATGLHLGVVEEFEMDKDTMDGHRIKVRVPALDHMDNIVWARVARPDAGKDRGFAFWPEKGDEVVLGFLDDDPRHPVILGSLFSATQAAPKAVGAPTQDNKKRAIVSPSGAMIAFEDVDEAKSILTIKTPGGRTIVIDDTEESITIKDKDEEGNTITMDKMGITIKSASDLTLDAMGKVTIKGSAVDIK